MIQLRKTLSEAHEALASEKIAHALIGGMALAVYGYHRSTSDIDFLADGTQKDRIKSCLQTKGFKLRFESAEVLQFAGLDILLAHRPISQEMLRNAIENPILKVHVLRAEDLIGLKIQAYKNDSDRSLRDKADIQELLKNPSLDMNIVKRYADLFQEWPEIEKLRSPK